jgi:rhodanese-related sulfurtransferase
MIDRGFRKTLLGDASADDIKRAFREGATIIDIRSDEEYEAGHVPGSVHIPLPGLLQNLASIPKDRPVVTCNADDALSTTAAEILGAHGFKAFDGGGWANVAKLLEQK